MLSFGGHLVPCALGRNGITARKREGDGATPAGRLGLVLVYYRPDRIRRPVTRLPVQPIRPDDGWCDDPADRNYNRPVKLPYGASHEGMWRKDHLYDVVVILGHNDRPRIRGAGSAVFFHLADPQGGATAGCIAVSAKDMRKVLALCGRKTRIKVW
jgi:L,D-peptidoglycan transpeptidase YkuD (ErfK/YbiS/YcfS/YnhG family)